MTENQNGKVDPVAIRDPLSEICPIIGLYQQGYILSFIPFLWRC